MLTARNREQFLDALKVNCFTKVLSRWSSQLLYRCFSLHRPSRKLLP